MRAPCKNCENRHPTCHGSCEEYQKYRNFMDKLCKERKMNVEITSLSVETRLREHKKKRSKYD